jgi:hypothetical protein
MLVKHMTFEELDEAERRLQERAAYRSSGVNTPVTGKDWLQTGVYNVGIPYISGNLAAKYYPHIKSFFTGEKPISASKTTMKDTLKGAFLPSLPGVALLGLVTALRAFNHPDYKNKTHGYMASLKNTLSGDADTLEQSGAELKNRYGSIASLPMRAAHMVMNPVGATALGIKKVLGIKPTTVEEDQQ